MTQKPPAKPIVTRFAPSPTGYLHVGNARTALFSYLYAKANGGVCKLRVEDTDKARSTDDAIDKIFEGLGWLMGADVWPRDETVFQSKNVTRHAAVAQEMLDSGNAYKCFATPEELDKMRNAARTEGRSPRYDGRWRDRAPGPEQGNAPFVVRLKAEQDGVTVINDHVQGRVEFRNDVLDDLVLLRSDGTPTYMLAVVVDDHDMGVTHVIRGDDHLINAGRQNQIYKALGWDAPEYAHLPLIHGPDGAKLSKRHGAVAVADFRDMGILSDAMFNYLVRLGWSSGDEEIISRKDAARSFDLDRVNKAAARFDYAKLESVNRHYLKAADDKMLLAEMTYLVGKLGLDPGSFGDGANADAGLKSLRAHEQRFLSLVPVLKERSPTVLEMIKDAAFAFVDRPIPIEPKALKLLNDDNRSLLGRLHEALGDALSNDAAWTTEAIEAQIRSFAEAEDLGFGKVAQPLRASVAGRMQSPGLFDVLYCLGRAESLARLADQAKSD